MGHWKKENERQAVLASEYLKKCHPHPRNIQEPDSCPACGGWGALSSGGHGESEECSTCQGTGEVWK